MRNKSVVPIALAIAFLALGSHQAFAVELKGVYFIDLNRGWAVGDGGTLLKTIDGGAEWVEVETEVEYNLNSIHFYGPKIGCTVGDVGTILHTTDGGENWHLRKVRPLNNLNQMFYADGMHGWIAGDNGTILVTEDGGATWEPQESDTPNNLTGVHFISLEEGWIVGSRGTILHTTNGGKKWEAQDIGTALQESPASYRTRRAKGNPINSLTSVHFSNAKQGWATGLFGLLLTTNDGGKPGRTKMWDFASEGGASGFP